MELHELSATEAVGRLRSGELSPVEYVQALLNRIEATEPRVHAWETLDGQGAMAAARHLEARRRERLGTDLLFGLPIAIKDVYHVRGLPTTCNFEPFRNGEVAGEDAGLVQHLREAGAIIMGKAVTTQFAYATEGVATRNPWNPERTAGGSSSGSAAAVGAYQVPVGIGTQTGGSTLRPAAYCGAVAIKPTFGRISRYGLYPVSWSLDHPGIIVRTVADAALVLQALARHDSRDAFSEARPPEDFVAAARRPHRSPRLGLLLDLLERSEPDVRQAAEAAAERLARAGAEVSEARLPVPMDRLLGVHFFLQNGEGATVHADLHAQYADFYRPTPRASIEVGLLVPASLYVRALRARRRLAGPMLDLLGSFDGIIAPTAPNVAPDPSTTGDPSFQSIWTMFGVPNVSIPMGLSADRLPYGLQIVGRPFEERALLSAAAWCESILGHLPVP